MQAEYICSTEFEFRLHHLALDCGDQQTASFFLRSTQKIAAENTCAEGDTRAQRVTTSGLDAVGLSVMSGYCCRAMLFDRRGQLPADLGLGT